MLNLTRPGHLPPVRSGAPLPTRLPLAASLVLLASLPALAATPPSTPLETVPLALEAKLLPPLPQPTFRLPPAEPTSSSLLPEAPAPETPVAETSITVSAQSAEIAVAQVQLAERQRVLGVVPNFYASYVWDAAPLSPRQKFALAWRFSTDPSAFLLTAVAASIQQAQNTLPGYRQGSLGYAKRFSASYLDGLSSTVLGQAVFPSLFHQDPRFFVKPTGGVADRTAYALASTVLCRGDNGHWQVNASNIAGNFAAAGLSDLYYPAGSRGISTTLNTALLTTASGALGNLMQQFVLRRMTPDVPDYATH